MRGAAQALFGGRARTRATGLLCAAMCAWLVPRVTRLTGLALTAGGKELGTGEPLGMKLHLGTARLLASLQVWTGEALGSLGSLLGAGGPPGQMALALGMGASFGPSAVLEAAAQLLRASELLLFLLGLPQKLALVHGGASLAPWLYARAEEGHGEGERLAGALGPLVLAQVLLLGPTVLVAFAWVELLRLAVAGVREPLRLASRARGKWEDASERGTLWPGSLVEGIIARTRLSFRAGARCAALRALLPWASRVP